MSFCFSGFHLLAAKTISLLAKHVRKECPMRLTTFDRLLLTCVFASIGFSVFHCTVLGVGVTCDAKCHPQVPIVA